MDGTLIKIAFDVSKSFDESTSFIRFSGVDSQKTILFDSSFDIIDSNFSDGILQLSCLSDTVVTGTAIFDIPVSGKLYIQTYLDSNYTDLNDTNTFALNEQSSYEFSLSIPQGSYYVKAYLDSNSDTLPDSIESTFYLSHPIDVSNEQLNISTPLNIHVPESADTGDHQLSTNGLSIVLLANE